MKKKDLVCSMMVSTETGLFYNYKDENYYFCCEHCKNKFKENPKLYIEQQSDNKPSSCCSSHQTHEDSKKNIVIPPGSKFYCPMLCEGDKQYDTAEDCPKCGMALEIIAQSSVNQQYVCPMHPEIVANNPNDVCPKCGMTLELKTPSLNDNSDYLDMRKRFNISLIFTIPLLILSMGSMLLNSSITTGEFYTKVKPILELLLATPVVLWCGLPFLKRAILSIKNKSLNMFTLIGLGVGAGYLYSLMAVLFPGLFPEGFKNSGEHINIYFESAAVIVTLVILGQMLEARGRHRTSSAIRSLMELAPTKARKVIYDDDMNITQEIDVNLDSVKKEDILRVRLGEKVPVDGVIIEGSSSIDEALITGEAIPVEKTSGDNVTGGTINKNGTFLMKAINVGSETVLARIIELVNEAQRSKAPMQQIADKVASIFVPVVMLIAIVTFVVWSLFGPAPALAFAIINAITVLIISCPCALGLATPMSIMVSMGKGASSGVLFKNAEALEQLNKIQVLVVDKTGTLTEGKPKVTDIIVHNSSEKDLLQIAGALETNSEHPLAEAIITASKEKGLYTSTLKNSLSSFKATPGKGIQGEIDNKIAILGSGLFMKENNIEIPHIFDEKINNIQEEGTTVVFLAFDSKFIGLIAIKDPIKKSAFDTLTKLKNLGIKLVMATGDSKKVAEAVAKQLHIHDVFSGTLPQDKSALIEKYQSEGLIVAMAGDGVNDAPALAKADISIAMGTGSHIAMETSSITLIKGDIAGIPRAIKISKDTMTNIKQNLVFAFIYNIFGITIATGLFYPLLGVLLSPMIAAAAMSLSSVSVIANSLRLQK